MGKYRSIVLKNLIECSPHLISTIIACLRLFHLLLFHIFLIHVLWIFFHLMNSEFWNEVQYNYSVGKWRFILSHDCTKRKRAYEVCSCNDRDRHQWILYCISLITRSGWVARHQIWNQCIKKHWPIKNLLLKHILK
jgi:hypothetical protein